MKRKTGVLLHISSLPCEYGIGTLGVKAYQFIDFLKNSNQKYWQILPIGPTTYKDSPYQSFSAFAGNPYFIDLDFLYEEGLLKKEALSIYKQGLIDNGYVNYEWQYNNKFSILKMAFLNFKKNNSYYEFYDKNKFWLEDYALFMAIKEKCNEKSWREWPDKFKYRDNESIEDFKNENKKDYEFWLFIQFVFDKQWKALKYYANINDIEIIGDMPIYVAMDSADVWSDPKSWQINDDLYPSYVAGCPPDMFAPLGQLWGNPLYNYKKMKDNNYSWWVARVKKSFELFDVLRIDHFRGFEAYYSIEYGKKDATVGEWIKGPNVELFNVIKSELGNLNIIAEDLGFLTEEVHIMLDKLAFPGMKIFQFGFNRDDINSYSPCNIIENCVLYPGTHDNPTIKGWFYLLDLNNKKYVLKKLNTNRRNFVYSMIKKCLKSRAKTVIIPIQDYLELDDKSRMNIPGTNDGNWIWRVDERMLTNKLSNKMKKLSKRYNR